MSPRSRRSRRRRLPIQPAVRAALTVLLPAAWKPEAQPCSVADSGSQPGLRASTSSTIKPCVSPPTRTSARAHSPASSARAGFLGTPSNDSGWASSASVRLADAGRGTATVRGSPGKRASKRFHRRWRRDRRGRQLACANERPADNRQLSTASSCRAVFFTENGEQRLGHGLRRAYSAEVADAP
jgi:hypothetical protein